MTSSSKNVSRETFEKLEIYEKLLSKWQARINLVSPDSLPHYWSRHVDDSLQLLDYLPQTQGPLVDMGSGAGFPGMVLAIAGIPNVHLIESDLKKCTFLRTVARETSTHIMIYGERIEKMIPFKAAIITARGLAKISKILEDSAGFIDESTSILLLKGKNAEEEIKESQKHYHMNIETFPSTTSPEGVIVKLSRITRRKG